MLSMIDCNFRRVVVTACKWLTGLVADVSIWIGGQYN